MGLIKSQSHDSTVLRCGVDGALAFGNPLRGFANRETSGLTCLVLEFVNTVIYAESILDAGGGGRVVPGLAALGDSTNAAQRQKRPVP